MTFEFTHEMAMVSNRLWAVPSAVGAGLCFLVLLVIAAVGIHPRSRSYLDRVSFRIVVYTLIANMIFGISSAVGGSETGPGFICGFSVFILQLTLHFSSCLLFAIALNLQLVIVHRLNGQKLEKYYLIVSAVIAIVLAVPPYATGQYGWDPLERVCWYTSDNRHERVLWQATTQMGWTAITVIGEVTCSIVVLVFMMRHNARTRKIFVPVRTFTETTTASGVVIANRHRNIIFRIGLYPIASCCVNLLSVATALHSTLSNGIHDRTDYNILLLSDTLYGGRAIVYALLAASDPALIRGVRALISHVTGETQGTTSSGMKGGSTTYTEPDLRPNEVFVELSTITATDKLPNEEADTSRATGDHKDEDHRDRQPHHEKYLSDADPDATSNNNNYDVEVARVRSGGLRNRMREARKKDKEELEAFTRQI
ncbi:hypothetical protein PLEOSDRAFT_159773 [Pleurotus ostreatus PC15]|uniref:G-protein coupled receptors family 2 profile 2 domain-containing protein n=2 Tax=Pleurotus TaxID=5320 RepID=A0A067NH76_PLEO1|nr:hypothetical protein CCMSSC00406_0007856 [Pleurotus cornucopiae]KDQ26305.1 hypothetical protein PLEOSDRAFT_159773 [Pleurotus ostreatus PC15]